MRKMKRWCSLLLAVVMLLSMLPSAMLTASAADCEHDWIDGYCQLCGETCSHGEWTSDSYCTICGKECSHDWMGGGCMICGKQCYDHMWNHWPGGDTICEICGTECQHQWNNGCCLVCARVCDHPQWDPQSSMCTTCGVECTFHNWLEGVCQQCGRECSHSWSNGTCTICQMSMGCEHNWENSVCTLCGVTCTHSWKDGTCTVCGKKCTAHSWSDGVCTICTKKCAHNWSNSTCTICGKSCTSHSWKDGTCTVCGKKCTSHSWSNGVCSTCGKECAHAWSVGTCTVCGKAHADHSWSNGTCTVCAKACSHSWDSGTITTEPTDTATGVKTFTCATCGATRTETVDAKGHSYQNGICTDCGIYQEGVPVTTANRKSLGLSSSFVGYYAIGNAGQLMWFRDKVTNGTDRSMKVVLTADISLKGVDYTPPTGLYTGIFDGNGHTISDLTLTSEKAEKYVSGSYPHYENLGLFCYIYRATVQNVTIKGSITLTEGLYYSGAVAGVAQESTIRNVDSYITYTNTTDSHYIQYPCGIAGYLYGSGAKIQNCRYYGSIDLDYAYGAAGIVGRLNDSTTVSDCTNYGNIDVQDGSYVGGIVAQASGGPTIERCLNVGSLELGRYCCVAGIAAECSKSVTIRDCGNVGTIIARPSSSLAYISGIVSYCGTETSPSSVTGCYNIGTVKDETNPNSTMMGVIVGYTYKGSTSSSMMTDETVYGNYYLEGTVPYYNYSGVSPFTSTSDATAVTSSQVTSGELAYRLNGSKNAGIWKQTLGTDRYPNFSGENVNYSSKYYNSHNYVNGYCTGCGAACTHSWSNGACTLCGQTCAHLSYTDGKCSVCGLACTHSTYENGFCEECGAYQQPGGTGTASDPYLIDNAGKLYWFAAKVNGGATASCAKLTANITDNPGTFDKYGNYKSKNGEALRSWTPIGIHNKEYTGTFDGNGKTVSGLYYNDNTGHNAGFFIYINDGATIKSLGIVNSAFTQQSDSVSKAGGLVAEIAARNADVTLSDCYSTAYVCASSSASTAHCGGLVGYVQTENGYKLTLTNCYNTGMVKSSASATSNAGGLIGACCNAVGSKAVAILGCYNTGDVSASAGRDADVGGLVGFAYYSLSFLNCYNTGNLIGASGSSDLCMGGLLAYASLNSSSSITVENCYNTGSIEGSSRYTTYIGGVIGTYNKGEVRTANCYYLTGTAEKGVAKGTDTTTAKSADEFASGAVAWLLNGETADGVWKQNLGTDAAPSFSGKTVYCGYNTCAESAAPTYANSTLSVERLEHTWSEGFCTACDKEHEDHSWDDGTCTVCGLVHADHSWEDDTCTVCGKVCTHSWNDGEVTTDPTCVNEGVKTFTCSACGTTRTEPVDIVDHSWSDGTCSGCGLVCGHESYDNGFCKVCDSYQQPSGTGTQSDPYLIENAGQLYWFARKVNKVDSSACARLMADITVNPGTFDADGNYTPKNGESLRSWNPIGGANYLEDGYAGTFDGNGKTVSGLYFNSYEAQNVGMFCTLIDKAIVKNLGVLDSFFLGIEGVGAIAGAAKLYDVTSTQNIQISGCYSNSIVKGNYYVGGLVGKVFAHVENVITIENCYTTGRVIGISKIGGLIACVSYATVRNCYSTASLTYEADTTTGELFGEITSDGKTISNCYFIARKEGNGVGMGSAAVTAKTKEQFASGEVTWLLNGEKADGVWKQTLGESGDALPGFTGETVYFGYNPCVGEYSNQPLPYDKPNHSWESGVCTLCGAVCEHESYENSICTECGEPCPHENYDNGFCEACDAYQQPSGTGKKDDPYLIANAGQLYWFAAKVNGGASGYVYAKLTADITINNNVLKSDGTLNGDGKSFRLWTPIGNTKDSKYSGSFDGDGHTISGLYYNGSAEYVGLFGITDSVVITNLTLRDSYFRNTSNTDTYIGRLVGWIYMNKADIRNCAATGTIIATIGGDNMYLYAGGLIGRADSDYTDITIRNCYASGLISANPTSNYRKYLYAGGLMGSSSLRQGESLNIMNCYSACTISAGVDFSFSSSSRIGGLLGYCYVSSWTLNLENSYYLEAEGLDAVGRINSTDIATVVNEAEAVSAYQFAKGEITWLLNGETPEGTEEAPLVWKQTLGTDAYPGFTGETVYCGYYTCDTDAAMGYGNEPASADRLAHSWSNGTCSVCGLVCTHEWNDSTCTVCGEECTEHSWGTDGTCTVCGKLCEHDWFNGVCKTCSLVCKHTSLSAVEGYNYDKCDTCGLCQVEYITCDADGSNRRTATTYAQELECYINDGGTLTLESGWYVVKELVIFHNDINQNKYDSVLDIRGEVNLILPNDTGSFIDGEVVSSNYEGRLNIYAQSEDIMMASFGAKSDGSTTAIQIDVTVNGGYASFGDRGVNSKVIDDDCTLTINGGMVRLWTCDEGKQRPYNGQPILNGGILCASTAHADGVFGGKPITRAGSCWKVSADTEFHDLFYRWDETYASPISYETYAELESIGVYKTMYFEPCTQHVADPDAEGYPKLISSTTHAQRCLYCGTEFQEEHTFTDGSCACGITEAVANETLDTALVFTNYALSLESSITTQFIVNAKKLSSYSDFKVAYVHIKADGTEESGELSTVAYGTKYRVAVLPTRSVEMCDTFRVTLYGYKDGQWYRGEAVDWTVRDGTLKMMRTTSKESLKTLLASMLNYGAAAQIAFSYNTENLANATMTTEEAAYAKLTPDNALVDNSGTIASGSGCTFQTGALRLSSAIEMQFIFRSTAYTADKLEAHISFTRNGTTVTEVVDVSAMGSAYCVVSYTGLGSKEMRKVVTCELFNKATGESASPKATYSGDSYAYSIANNAKANEATKNLANAMICYVDAAIVHFG